ncbi:MAG: class I tRNA ligase family protein, partial [bacterium]|nr:class I tRNA ligase family protein [bacterium]
DDKKIRQDFDKLTASVGFNIERYSFAYAQEKLCQFLSELEKYAQDTQVKINIEVSLFVLRDVYAGYLTLLHPFMPFMTEELYLNLYNPASPLAVSPWPSSRRT